MQNKSSFSELGLMICINPARTVINHIGTFKPAFLELFIRNLQIELIKASQGWKSQSKDLLLDVVCSTYRFGWIPLFLRSPKHLEFLSFHLSVSNLHSLPWKTVMNHVSKVLAVFPRDFDWLPKSVLIFLKLSGYIQIYAHLSQI